MIFYWTSIEWPPSNLWKQSKFGIKSLPKYVNNYFQKRGFEYSAEEGLQFSNPYPPPYYQVLD